MRNLRNSVTLIGRVGKEPKIVNFENGGRIANFSLATSDSYRNKAGEKIEETQWHNLVVRDGMVKIVEDFVKKGKEIAIEGKLVTRSWDDKEGNKHYVTEVLVNDVLLLGRKDS